jgi:hypothetical protein
MLLTVSTIIAFYTLFFWSVSKLNKSVNHQSLSEIDFSHRLRIR